MATDATPVDRAHLVLFALGTIRGLRKAAEFSGLSRHEIVALTDANLIAWYPHGERGDRMISKRSLIEYLARQYGAYATGTGART